MASTYTVNLGIEKIGTGEQSGTWGNTTNTNFDLIDQAVNGAVTVTLASAGTSGSPNTLAITDGASSDGRNKFIEFADGADLGATAYIQLTPNDAEKIVHMRNSLSGGRSVIVFQGTYNASNDFEIPNGKDVVLKFDGAGASATVTDVNADLYVTKLSFNNLKGTGATTVTNILDEDNMASDSATALATQQSIKAYVDSQVGTVDTLAEILANGNTTGGTDIAVGTGDDITFADSSKAIFGAGSDLQIYHDGTHSYVADVGSGVLFIRGETNVVLESNSGSNYFEGTAGGASRVYYSGNEKLTTTATGIDVTGTVTADGLTSAGDVTIQDSDLRIDLTSAPTASGQVIGDLLFRAENSFGGRQNAGLIRSISESNWSVSREANMEFHTTYNSSLIKRAEIANNGDISFYEDTGTTPKFFWDASAESLGIGTTSPATMLELAAADNDGTNAPRLRITNSSTTLADGARVGTLEFHNSDTTGSGPTTASIEAITNSSDERRVELTFNPGFNGSTTEAMRIDSDGNVGIGTTSPARPLTVNGLIGSRNSTTGFGTSDGFDIGVGGSDAYLVQRENANIIIETNGAERMRITSSGNVGIGTSSPGVKLDVSGMGRFTGTGATSGDAPTVLLANTTATTGRTFGLNSQNSGYFQIYDDDAGGATRLVIDASGNVGIGTASPSGNLHVVGGEVFFTSTGNSKLQIKAGNTSSSFIEFGDPDDGNVGRLLYGHSDNSMQFTVNASERMRLDASGNLLVGKTASAIGTAGFEAAANGNVLATRSAGVVMSFNRLSTDGAILDIRKDGTTVGVIGTLSGENYIGNANTDGILFGTSGGEPLLQPMNAGVKVDGQGLIGSASNRWKDLYLSAGAYASFIAGQNDTNTSINFPGSDVTVFYTGGSERMRIDSSGNVGIGTTSPNRLLHVEGTASTFGDTRSVLQVADDTAMAAGVGGGISFTGKSSTGQTDSNTMFAAIHGEKENGTSTNTAGAMVFSTRTSGSNPAERMRIDSSGNWMLGTTDSNLFTSSSETGLYVTSTGQIRQAVGSAVSAYFNRQGTDGDIINFRKDGTTVGSIGARNGKPVFTQDSGDGLRLGGGAMHPVDSSNPDGSDGTYDIGASAFRFKDLYLSGGAKIGTSGRTTYTAGGFYDNAASGNNIGVVTGGGHVFLSDGNGTATDNVNDIGSTNRRVKDVYVGGGIYLGGIVSSNKLDDYEEGTWTPTCVCTGQTITTTQAIGKYTKIGRIVHAECAIIINTVSGTASGATQITGLPFNNNGDSYTGVGALNYNDGFANTLYASWIQSTTAFMRSGTRSQANDGGGFSAGGYINIRWTYITNA